MEFDESADTPNQSDVDDMPTGYGLGELVAYRLGKVEKAVDHFNNRSVDRDNKILEKLSEIGEISQKVNEHGWRLASLEESRKAIYKFLGTIAAAVVVIIAELIFNLV